MLNIQIGDVVHGHCRGWFGRGEYADKRAEAVGRDWVVFRSCEDGTVFLFDRPFDFPVEGWENRANSLLDEWRADEAANGHERFAREEP